MLSPDSHKAVHKQALEAINDARKVCKRVFSDETTIKIIRRSDDGFWYTEIKSFSKQSFDSIEEALKSLNTAYDLCTFAIQQSSSLGEKAKKKYENEQNVIQNAINRCKQFEKR